MMTTIELLYGIVLLSMVPVRNEPSEQSEMVTQLLFGDTFTIVEQDGGWLHICNDYDSYEGWVSARTVQQLDSQTYQLLKTQSAAVVASYNAVAQEQGKAPIHLTIGSFLPSYDAETKSFKIGDRLFQFVGEVTSPPRSIREEMYNYGKRYLQTPYLWGGRSPYGIDCSGFTQQVAKLVGIALPRDASQQVSCGEEVSFLSAAKVGDLAFFDNEEGRITHVGMLIGEQRILHASGSVRIDSIDNEGIFNLDLQRYTHHLRTIRNITEE